MLSLILAFHVTWECRIVKVHIRNINKLWVAGLELTVHLAWFASYTDVYNVHLACCSVTDVYSRKL